MKYRTNCLAGLVLLLSAAVCNAQTSSAEEFTSNVKIQGAVTQNASGNNVKQDLNVGSMQKSKATSFKADVTTGSITQTGKNGANQTINVGGMNNSKVDRFDARVTTGNIEQVANRGERQELDIGSVSNSTVSGTAKTRVSIGNVKQTGEGEIALGAVKNSNVQQFQSNLSVKGKIEGNNIRMGSVVGQDRYESQGRAAAPGLTGATGSSISSRLVVPTTDGALVDPLNSQPAPAAIGLPGNWSGQLPISTQASTAHSTPPTTECSTGDLIVPTFGRYGGPCWTAGGRGVVMDASNFKELLRGDPTRPTSELDKLFFVHDFGYSDPTNRARLVTDKLLVQSLSDYEAKGWYDWSYTKAAQLLFSGKVVLRESLSVLETIRDTATISWDTLSHMDYLGEGSDFTIDLATQAVTALPRVAATLRPSGTTIAPYVSASNLASMGNKYVLDPVAAFLAIRDFKDGLDNELYQLYQRDPHPSWTDLGLTVTSNLGAMGANIILSPGRAAGNMLADALSMGDEQRASQIMNTSYNQLLLNPISGVQARRTVEWGVNRVENLVGD